MHAKWFLAFGALNAALTVALGAAANHAWRGLLAANDPAGWFATALEYHRYHALGLLVVGLAAARFPASRWFVVCGWLIVAGLVLFCGNLYLRSIAGIHAFHAVTPFGGAAFILGWLGFAAGVLLLPGRRK